MLLRVAGFRFWQNRGSGNLERSLEPIFDFSSLGQVWDGFVRRVYDYDYLIMQLPPQSFSEYATCAKLPLPQATRNQKYLVL